MYESDLSLKRTMTLGRVVVAESLDRFEYRTGKELAIHIDKHASQHQRHFRSQYRDCPTVEDLLALIAELVREATETGLVPMLHVESHGDSVHGLMFADESWLAWDQLCEALTPLNRATRFELVVTTAACYGFAIWDKILLSRGAPAQLLIGPTDKLRAVDIEQGYKLFYGRLAETLNLSAAVIALQRVQLREGEFAQMSADRWFKVLTDEFFEFGVRGSAKKIAMLHHLREKAAGRPSNLSDQKRVAMRGIKAEIHLFFRRFFMTDEVPANRDVFAELLRPYAIDERVR